MRAEPIFIPLDEGAASLLDRFHAVGHAAYAVGGCVRDSLLGLVPHDWDLCTSATPAEVLALFGEEHCIPTGLQHGTVTVIPASAAKGATVTVITAPDKGYVLETLTVTDSTGNVLMLTDRGAGSFTFVMPAGHVEVRATFAEDNSVLNFFYDVPNDAYFYEAVKWAVGKGITTGVGGNLFAPEDPCSRAQIVTFLWRAAGSPEPRGTTAGMSDVVLGSYYEKAVAWAIENGITTGTGEGKFSPEDPCTRAQAVTFLARALNAKAAGTAAFSDVPADSYFADAVAWAQANGVTTGTSDTTFSPNSNCLRAQIVSFLYRAAK